MRCQAEGHHPDNHVLARWWVVRTDTGSGRRVCGHHIPEAIRIISVGGIDNLRDTGLWFTVQPLEEGN